MEELSGVVFAHAKAVFCFRYVKMRIRTPQLPMIGWGTNNAWWMSNLAAEQIMRYELFCKTKSGVD